MKKKKTEEEKQEIIWEELLLWLTGSETLPKEVRNYFVEHAQELRLKMQALVVQMQVKNLHQIALDIDHEEELKKELREELPFMTTNEKSEILKTLNSVNSDKLKRVEAQLAGFDFFNTIEVGIQSINDIKASAELVNRVRSIEAPKRKQLISTLTKISEEIEKEEKENLLDETGKS